MISDICRVGFRHVLFFLNKVTSALVIEHVDQMENRRSISMGRNCFIKCFDYELDQLMLGFQRLAKIAAFCESINNKKITQPGSLHEIRLNVAFQAGLRVRSCGLIALNLYS